LYREAIIPILKLYFCTYDPLEIEYFLTKETKKKGWEIFNYLFIIKAIDLSLDYGNNEKEECSKLLNLCT